jgi:hypothetical protein
MNSRHLFAPNAGVAETANRDSLAALRRALQVMA